MTAKTLEHSLGSTFVKVSLIPRILILVSFFENEMFPRFLTFKPWIMEYIMGITFLPTCILITYTNVHVFCFQACKVALEITECELCGQTPQLVSNGSENFYDL